MKKHTHLNHLPALIALPILFSSALVMAYPHVGDKTEFAGKTYEKGVMIQEFSASREYLEQNPETKKWTIKEQMKTPDKEIERTAETDFDYTHETFVQVIRDCLNQNGILETLITPAGMFDTCKVDDDFFDKAFLREMEKKFGAHKGKMALWLGDVPSGVVKATYQTRSGKIHQMELSAVTINEPTEPVEPPQTPPQEPVPPQQPAPPQPPEQPAPPHVPELPPANEG